MNMMRPQIFQIPVYRIDLFCLGILTRDARTSFLTAFEAFWVPSSNLVTPINKTTETLDF